MSSMIIVLPLCTDRAKVKQRVQRKKCKGDVEVLVYRSSVGIQYH